MAHGESTLGGQTAPLAVRMRPRSLEEVAGQEQLLKTGSPLQVLATPGSQSSVSVILWGPPGTGKTSLAHAIATSSDRRCVELSAVTAGVKDVRTVMEEAQSQRDLYGVRTLLFLDEIHRFSKAQQDALLPGVENGWVTLIAATTENPSFSVVTPLLSRSLLLRLEPLSNEALDGLIQRALDEPFGLAKKFNADADARSAIINFASGDARRVLTSLEAAAAIAQQTSKKKTGVIAITAEHVSAAVDSALLRYDRNGDEHYDVISAFIKSIRGSDPDAAVHYLARMIAAGEDPRFIARRLIISASEDIGLADPQALGIATAAADAVAMIGMPEGRIPLSEATIYLATAPKSNAAYLAINQALADVQAGKSGSVPKHLRDAHYAGAKKLGHGKGYDYPHDNPLGVVEQQYLPDTLKQVEYYSPTDHGAEREIHARLEKLRAITKKRR
ncbi:replication-associated recombination protein A [Aurantimicrobium minutum]|uniref:replication-associated recombination protein A n=1 Tax=Aurantimicrobium minutum TaxID=708131 RepID=UPI002475BB12|nr:replication-associated recombination protein A [Aurantimicrobium minutum]MDH6422565.1 putative ATPase [Aurantimicrobium minutum]